MILVDSTVWIDYFIGKSSAETNYLDTMLPRNLVLIGDIILAEVLQGFRSDRDFDQARQALEAFEQVSLVSPALAVQSAIHYRNLRRFGISVRKTIDCLIATWCLAHDVPLLHTDRDFDAFERYLGLRVLHPESTL